ncbi:glycosyl transferase family 1 [Desulfuromonas versatilis]|uniref:Glycosyl transferase family 1 n=1 Tax=Desulfuromonas versatilis TaxID=2802975 RepID=A0ABM8HSI5_9BACT|nr:FtsX-like permease family protein [Desulfuromonas versatilis]BCR03422.1 glycosyl transferase family 1 [Desulfuromonas versatilis]
MMRLAELALAARLARREMRSGLRGFGVFLACLFLGVFAVSAVGSFSGAARRGLSADARSLLGGDLEVRLVHRELGEQQRAFLEQRGELSTVVEMRTMARRADEEARALVELKGVDGAYPFYGTAQLAPQQPLAEALAMADGEYGAAVDRSLLERLGLQLGQGLRVGQTTFRLRAVLEREPDRSIQGFTLGPRLLVDARSLPATGLVTPGSLITYAYRLKLYGKTLADQATVGALIEELNARFPDAGWRLRGFSQAAPRVRYFLERMTTNLTLVALCALLVGGLGVAGAVRGYLGGKVLHIAAMKCLGAPGRVIFAAYLLQMLVLGLMGSGAGLAAGAALPFAAAAAFGEALPIPLAPRLEPAVLAVAAGFGLLVALTFSLRDLGSARRVPPALLFRSAAAGAPPAPGKAVNLAVAVSGSLLALLAVAVSGDRRLALWFVAGAALCFALFWLLARAVVVAARRAPRSANPSLRLALAGIHRPGAPAPKAVFSLGLGLTALATVALVEGNLGALVRESIPAEAPAFFFIDIQPDQAAEFDRLVASLPAVTRSERVPTLRGRITAIAGVPVERAVIRPEVSWAVRGDRYLTYAARPPVNGKVTAGAWWPETYAGPPRVSLTADVAEGFGVGIGDTLTVNVLGREVTAEIANLRTVDWSSLELNFALVFAPGTLEAAPQTHIATVYAPAPAEEAVFKEVGRRFPNVSAIRVKEVLQNVSRILERIGGSFRAMAALVLLSGFLVLAGAVSADQHRRLYDAVVFKVCGATRRDILLAFGAEFLLVGLAAGLLSALVGSLAAWGVVAGLMNAEFTWQPLTVALTLLTGLALTLLFGLLGTARVLTRKAAPYLRNE